MVGHKIGVLMSSLVEDVGDELVDSFPEELRRTPLRNMPPMRPNARARSLAKLAATRKFAHLTDMQRYERAVEHSAMLPATIRMLDAVLLEHLVILSEAAVQVQLPKERREIRILVMCNVSAELEPRSNAMCACRLQTAN